MSKEAVKYAKKELEVELYCIGPETAYLEKDMKGANFWLQHAESEVARMQEEQKAGRKMQEATLAELIGEESKGKGKGKANTNSSDPIAVPPHGALTDMSEPSARDGSRAQYPDQERVDLGDDALFARALLATRGV